MFSDDKKNKLEKIIIVCSQTPKDLAIKQHISK